MKQIGLISFFVIMCMCSQQFLATAAAQRGSAKTESSGIKEIARRYQSFDMDADRTNEIDKLTLMKFRGVTEEPLQKDDKLVLVLVEDRLLKKISRSKHDEKDLLDRLSQYKSDLKNEGLETRFIECDVYSGPKHQDGQTLLAIRKFVGEVNDAWNLQGVVLVGSFPEATIVRRWIWKRKDWDVTIAGKAYRGADRKDFLRIVPEAVAPRADIVLADLDGNWEEIYVKEKRELESIEALPAQGFDIFPKDGNFESREFNDKRVAFEDFFWVKEDDFVRKKSGKGILSLKLNTTDLQNPEVSKAERKQPNPLAVPDLLVSRINPRHIAVIPDQNFRGLRRNRLLDRNGLPQPFTTAKRVNARDYLKKDAAFERKLLIEYFDRNHAYRTGNKGGWYRTAAVSHGRGLASADSLNKYMESASSSFGPPISFNDASLLDYVEFLKSPASLKGICAHSNPWNSTFGKGFKVKELEEAIGGRPWRWHGEQADGHYQYMPSMVEQGGAADSYIHRTIYENKVLKDKGASVFIHIGCEVNTPENALRVPYSHPDYGSRNGFQNAESILFFLNGVALASRAKVFYDKPRGFTDEIGKDPTRRFGDGWKAYFEVESRDKGLVNNVAGNKRTYPWSIIGDWTLRLK